MYCSCDKLHCTHSVIEIGPNDWLFDLPSDTVSFPYALSFIKPAVTDSL